MTTISWTRRSSNARPFRGSSSQFTADVAGIRQSRSVERQSRIPIRSSSQVTNRDRPTYFQRSKSQIPNPAEETPISAGKFSPPQSSHGSKTTPICSSRALKKLNFCKDTRNLHDKEYLKEAEFIVQGYFQEKCPDIIINGVEIRPMTIKMFTGMVNYLFEALDIVDKRQEPVRFEATTYEKELPYWMKKLNYPGLITKAWLQTVYAPNNWHHVIGFLSWLVKLCQISALFNIEEQLRIKSEDLNKVWKIFYFQQALQAFRIFNEGKEEEEYMMLRKKVIQKFYELNGVNEIEIQELESEIEELQKKLADPHTLAEKGALDKAVQKLKKLKAQYLKVTDDIAKEEDDMELTKAKILEKEENCESLKAAIEEKRKELETLTNVVSKQSTTVTEVAELRKRTEYLDKEITFLEKECEDYAQLVSRYEFEATSKRDTILQSTHTFNRTIIRLEQIIPELKGIRIYQDPENEEIINEMQKIIESLRAIKKNKVQTCEELEIQIRGKEKDVAMKMQSLKNLNDMIEKLEQSIEDKKKENCRLEAEYEEKVKSLREEMEKREEKLKTTEEKMKDFNSLREKQQTLQLRHEQLCRSLEKTEELAERFWTKVIDNWKHIPESLENTLALVKAQNIELKKGYDQLMTDLETGVNLEAPEKI